MESSGQANDIMAAINRHGIAVLAGPEARTATGASAGVKIVCMAAWLPWSINNWSSSTWWM